jgi:hypothetical protein
MRRSPQIATEGRCGYAAEAWASAVVEAVQSSTASQGLPELLEDDSVLHRVASVFGVPRRGDDDAAA